MATLRRDAAAVRPPGPAGLPLLGNTLQLARDPLAFLRACVRDHGDVVFLRVRGLDVYLVSGSDELHTVLVDREDAFSLDRLSRGLADALGESILVTDGPVWRDRRRTVLPAFRHEHYAGYARLIASLAEREVASWPRRGEVDVSSRMADLAIETVLATALGVDAPSEAVRRAVGPALDALMAHVRGLLGTGVRVPGLVPTPGNRRARTAVRALDDLLTELVTVDGARPGGVLALLLAAAERGALDQRQVRDEFVTMLLVGHETVALALGYALVMLADHPQLQETLQEETRTGTTGPQLDAFVRESLRLWPPVWAMGREAVKPVEVGGFHLGVGAQVLCPIWVNHRRPEWYADPDEFRPERWLDGSTDALPAQAYLPFGVGARTCLGQRLAQLEMAGVLTAVVRDYRLRPAGKAIEVQPSVTLRPRSPLRVLVERR